MSPKATYRVAVNNRAELVDHQAIYAELSVRGANSEASPGRRHARCSAGRLEPRGLPEITVT